MRFFFKLILRRIVLFASALTLASLTGYCGNDKAASERAPLTADERYLIESYVSVMEARALFRSDPRGADSLFARLDSTIDTLKISNTIKALNADPDRWASIFLEIEKSLKEPSYRGNLEESR